MRVTMRLPPPCWTYRGRRCGAESPVAPVFRGYVARDNEVMHVRFGRRQVLPRGGGMVGSPSVGGYDKDDQDLKHLVTPSSLLPVYACMHCFQR